MNFAAPSLRPVVQLIVNIDFRLTGSVFNLQPNNALPHGAVQAILCAFDVQELTNMPDGHGNNSPSDRLLALVKQILAKNSVARSVSVDDQLNEAGLSSIDMVNLMLAIEAEFELMIPASEITPANFRSISTIEALILKIKPRTPGS